MHATTKKEGERKVNAQAEGKAQGSVEQRRLASPFHALRYRDGLINQVWEVASCYIASLYLYFIVVRFGTKWKKVGQVTRHKTNNFKEIEKIQGQTDWSIMQSRCSPSLYNQFSTVRRPPSKRSLLAPLYSLS